MQSRTQRSDRCGLAVIRRASASASAIAAGAGFILAGAAAADNAIEDIQVGERGNLMRIAVICARPCAIASNTPSTFEIEGVGGRFDIPLAGRSELASALRIDEPPAGAAGARLSVVTEVAISTSRVTACTVADKPAACIDIAFASPAPAGALAASNNKPGPVNEAAPRLVEAASPVRAPSIKPAQTEEAVAAAEVVEATDTVVAAPSDAPDAVTADAANLPATADQRGSETAPPRPQLRGEVNADVLRFARFDAPRTALKLRPGGVALASRAYDETSEDKSKGPVRALRDGATPGARPEDLSGTQSAEAEDQEAPPRVASADGDRSTPLDNADGSAPGDADADTYAPDSFTPYDAGSDAQPATASVAEDEPVKLAALVPLSPATGAPEMIDIPGSREPTADPGFAAGAIRILGKDLADEACASAKTKLDGDAWALDAMVDHAFCIGAAGDLSEADQLFTRLLAYTPDNFEALVGRALIARSAGEKSVARKFFQDALTALPPIEESNRIVQAIDGL